MSTSSENLDRRRAKSQVLPLLRQNLPGQNLFGLAHTHSIEIGEGKKTNKGWVGQLLERIAGLDGDHLPRPDGSDFELKSTRMIRSHGEWAPKETIKVTQLNVKLILEEEFLTSRLWSKLERWILVTYYVENPTDYRILDVLSVEITNSKLISEIRTFWEDVRHLVCNGEIADHKNLGSSQGLIQLRPVGRGTEDSVCPITGVHFPSRAFYATKRLLIELMNP